MNAPSTSDLERYVFGTAAPRYAEAGLPVFPAKPDKTPFVPFKTAATTDLAQIELWATLYPDAMIGLPTGTTSGLAVLDIDVRENLDGFAALQERGYEIPENAIQVHTPSGGSHFYFALQPGEVIRNSAGKIAAGVDVRGEGGYVIAAPSENGSGKGYRFAEGFSVTSLKELVQ